MRYTMIYSQNQPNSWHGLPKDKAKRVYRIENQSSMYHTYILILVSSEQAKCRRSLNCNQINKKQVSASHVLFTNGPLHEAWHGKRSDTSSCENIAKSKDLTDQICHSVYPWHAEESMRDISLESSDPSLPRLPCHSRAEHACRIEELVHGCRSRCLLFLSKRLQEHKCPISFDHEGIFLSCRPLSCICISIDELQLLLLRLQFQSRQWHDQGILECTLQFRREDQPRPRCLTMQRKCKLLDTGHWVPWH